MRIKKTSNTRALAGKTVNAFSNSTTDAYNCDYVNKLTKYSSTEKIIGYTDDDKPVYRKCFNILVDSQNFTFNHNISNLDTIISYKASIKQGGYIYPIPYYSEVAGYTIEGGLSSTECYFKLGSSINYNQYATVILEYTKSS